jgi:predicted nucleotidyltransferase
VTIQGQLLEMLETVAAALGDDLCNQMVFVGGCSTAVLVTDEISLQEVRATDDVDLIIGLSGVSQWMQLEEKLREKGFTVSSEDKLICRMRLGNLKVDFMPDDPNILGFTNRWYDKGIQTSVKYALPSGRQIKHLTSPLFLATKFEAYNGRGKDDPLGSHDLEDIIILVDGRKELLEEIAKTDEDVRQYIAEQFSALQMHRDFEHFLDGNINEGAGRAGIVRSRIDAITDLSA